MLVAASGAVALHPVHETDPYWHLVLGESALAHRSRVVPEPYALPGYDAPNVIEEWAWSVSSHLLHRVGGFAAVTLAAALASAVVAWLVARLARRASPEGVGPSIAVAGLAMAPVVLKMTPRPEAIGLVFVALATSIGLALADATSTRRRLGLAGVAALVELVWAQTHGSFVIGPAILLAAVAPAALRARDARGRLEALAAPLVAFALLFSSAEGAHLFTYLRTHAGGDATRHIGEWQPLAWATFDPSEQIRGPAWAALFVLGLVALPGTSLAGAGEALLFVLGAALATKAVRMLSPSAILLVPLAARGAARAFGSSRARPIATLVGASVALFALGRAAREIDHDAGPIGRLGVVESAVPAAAAAFFERNLAPGARVVSPYDAGAAVGFLSRGRVRTWVDSRTPAYFDATDFALQRDAYASTRLLARAVARFDADAVMVARSPSCPGAEPPQGYAPVVVEAIYSTFAKAGTGRPLALVTPCGQDYLAKDACRDDGRALDAEIDALEALHASPFTRYLRAERVARCGGDAASAIALVPSVAEAAGWAAQRARVLGRLALATGDVARAGEALGPLVADGDRRAAILLGPSMLSGQVPREQAVGWLRAGLEKKDDGAAPEPRVLLATLCAREGDHECARFHAMRAALAGNRDARELVAWVASTHPDARVRADAAAWLAAVVAADSAAP